jgi:hypothetical protein
VSGQALRLWGLQEEGEEMKRKVQWDAAVDEHHGIMIDFPKCVCGSENVHVICLDGKIRFSKPLSMGFVGSGCKGKK